MTGDLCLVYFIVVLILFHKRVLRIPKMTAAASGCLLTKQNKK